MNGGQNSMDFLSKELIYQMSPQKITGLLYEKCIAELEQAITAIEQKEMIDANIHLQKVNDLLERLGAGINYEAGIIANQLDTLYNYMANEIITGNLKKDVSIIKEVLAMMEQIASAWNEASKSSTTDVQKNIVKQTNAYEKNIQTLK